MHARRSLAGVGERRRARLTPGLAPRERPNPDGGCALKGFAGDANVRDVVDKRASLRRRATWRSALNPDTDCSRNYRLDTMRTLAGSGWCRTRMAGWTASGGRIGPVAGPPAEI